MTGREIVSASLRLIGALAPGESLASSEATDGLGALNRMISGWSNESLLIPSRVREAFSLVPGTQTYTMGTGGDFDTSRPQRIDEAFLLVESSTPAIEYPVRILTLAEWAAISTKEMESSLPSAVFAEGAYPLERLNVYPKPTEAHKLVLWGWKPLAAIATLDTAVSLPPGYDEALIYNLAIRLSPEYGRPASQEVIAIATDSKTSIKRMNDRPMFTTPDAIPAGSGSCSGYNIYTGGSA